MYKKLNHEKSVGEKTLEPGNPSVGLKIGRFYTKRRYVSYM